MTPNASSEFEGVQGYALSAGSSVTLTYTGKLLVNEGSLQMNAVPGDRYVISVQGVGGSFASTEVTAG
ncbi:Uncharacterised protein [uncultured archaeon]|nr:Uncharacterised protein [uncultured archaeon]